MGRTDGHDAPRLRLENSVLAEGIPCANGPPSVAVFFTTSALEPSSGDYLRLVTSNADTASFDGVPGIGERDLYVQRYAPDGIKH